MPSVAPFGSWRSPITTQLITADRVGIGQVALDGDSIYWTESRPAEAGRVVLVRRRPDGRREDVTPAGTNVRTRVHEYGGGALAVREGVVVFVDFADGRLWRQDVDDGGIGVPRALTPAIPDALLRHADPVIDPVGRRVVCVQEDHRGGRPAVNRIVDVALDPVEGAPLPEPRVLVSGHDFYSNARLDPEGRRASWLAWDHPDLPWDGTGLWVADVGADGSFGLPRRVAGGRGESIFQPEWSPAGQLHFVSDRTDWWNLYRFDTLPAAGSALPEPRALAPMEAEFGEPQWVFGLIAYAFVGPDRLLCRYTRDGIWFLALLNASTGELRSLDLGGTWYGSMAAGSDGRAVVTAACATRDTWLVCCDTTSQDATVVAESSSDAPDERFLSIPEPVEFPTGDGETAHALFYAPRNPDFVGPDGELPPLLVNVHGGPTAMAGASLALGLQFWTSRGIAVLDVNYRGSSGYGRRYRELLAGRWGVVDLEDVVGGARFVAAAGHADPSRLLIRGGSAGGYTTLCAVTFRDEFRAGTSYFGIGDLEVFTRETHKFESRYMDGLLGAYPAAASVYHDRSPIHFVDRISCPVLLLQGLDDRIVPPDQAELMFEALRRRGMPVAYLAFEGEGHGFRRAETTRRTLEAELSFYGQVLGFDPADDIPRLHIENTGAGSGDAVSTADAPASA